MHDTNRSTVEIARSIVPQLREFAQKNEQLGELAPETLDLLRRHNLFGLYVPKDRGGLGLDQTEILEVLETIARADGSSGWVLMATSFAAGLSAAYLPEETAAALFRPGQPMPIFAGMGAPRGKAVAEKAGFRLSGRWGYGSGMKHADYVLTGAIVVDESGSPRLAADGGPETRLFVVPPEQVSFEGNWNVLGLRATGSIDYAIDNVFVAEEFSYALNLRFHDRGEIFRKGVGGLVPIGHAAFALGVSRRLLDELAEFARSKTGPSNRIGASESFHENFARHEARLRAARAFLFEVWNDIGKTIDAGSDLSTRQMSLIRLSGNHVTDVGGDIAEFAYLSAGGTSLRSGVLQRCVRDMFAATQHIAVSQGVTRACGKELAGLAPGQLWSNAGLVEPA